MDDGHFLAAAEMGELKCVLDEPMGFLLGGHLKGLHDTGVHLMLDAGELALGVLPHHGNIHVGVTGLDAGMRET